VSGFALPGGVEISDRIATGLHRMMDDLRGARWYAYPWEGLEDDLAAAGEDGVLVLGYGSLINRTSASRTVTSNTRRAAISFGLRRVFNYEIPLDNERYEFTADPLARAALNVRVTGVVEDAVNGVLMDVPLVDVAAFRAREVAYDLVQLPCIWWGDPDPTPFPAWVVRSPEDATGRTNNGIVPHRGYYDLCRRGASRFGDSYLAFWLATTYLADGITAVADWEQQRPAE
jgi:hypothetical protein